jgi:hypothetical protein
VASPNPNAIGTPAKTQNPATPTKKMIRLILPSGFSQPFKSQNTAITRATDRIAANTVRKLLARASRRNANSAIRQIPTGNAAARQLLRICSAGVVI